MKRFPILIFVFLFFSSCENDIAVVNLITSPSKLPVESGKDVKVIFSDSARIKAKLFAPQMDRYVKEDNAHLELPKGLVLDFYDKNMKTTSSLTANYAIRYEKEKRMEAKNNVIVVNEKGEKLNTEHLIWDEVSKKIYSEAFVRITTGDEIIYGDGFESNEDFSRYKIKNIKGTINLNESN